MSEYQYYEFRAVARPLTPEQMSELRNLSSRATITPHRFTNTYNYGDFRGDPRKLMESYFDAHVYVSNFGTSTFMLRLPRTVLAEATLAPYTTEDALDWWATDNHIILEWQLNGDPPGDWVEGEDWMDQLLPIRDELVRGDYRSLYIGWLASIGSESSRDAEDENEEDEDEFEADEEEDDTDDLANDDEGSMAGNIEPPVPIGLGQLTAAQAALAEFLDVDRDLIAAAALASPDARAQTATPQSADEWVARLPEAEIRSIVVRLVQDTGTQVLAELQSRYYRSLTAPTERAAGDTRKLRRTAAQLLAMVEQTARDRKQQEQVERQRKRHEQLAAIVPRLPELWSTVSRLAEEQKASSYDKVVTLLVDMRDAYGQVGRRPEFDAAFAGFRAQYGRSTALMRRLKAARLTA